MPAKHPDIIAGAVPVSDIAVPSGPPLIRADEADDGAESLPAAISSNTSADALSSLIRFPRK